LDANTPEDTSNLPPESAYFLAVNRNKRSMTVNFKKPEGQKIMYELVNRADILVENFIPGKLASMVYLIHVSEALYQVQMQFFVIRDLAGSNVRR
jgi:hypothetical protein